MPGEMGRAMGLENLVGNIENFKTEYWRQSPLYRRQANDTQFRELISLPDIDYLLADSRTRPPYVRVTLNGRKLDNMHITRQACIAHQTVTDVPDPVAIMRHFKNGATIILDSVQDSIRPVGSLNKEIASQLVGEVHAVAFITPPSVQGLTSHVDPTEVIVAQFSGTKKWRIYERLDPIPLKTSIISAARTGDPIMEMELKPGDVLYVPWGYPHDASSGEGISAHLSFAIRPPTWADVLSGVLSAALKEENLGESPGWSMSDETRFKADFLARLDELRCSISDSDYRKMAACLAWERYLQTGTATQYSSIADLPDL